MRASFINSSNNNFGQQPINPESFQSIDSANLLNLSSPSIRSVTSEFHSCITNINTTIDALVKVLSSSSESNEPFLRDILIIPLLNKVTEKLYILSDYVIEQSYYNLENEIPSCLGMVQNIGTLLKRNNIRLNDQDIQISHHLYNLNIEFETFAQVIDILEQKDFENFDLDETVIHDFHIALKNLSQTILDRCDSHKKEMESSRSEMHFA
jgi:hypothetical protein